MSAGSESLYKTSWAIYKAHSEAYQDDFDYYYSFCAGKDSLELFAGYGRLTNYLVSKGVSLETVEIEPNFAQLIDLPPDKNHVCDVLKFESKKQFERIIAGYNSFCLFQDETQIRLLFSKIEALLVKGGQASLSYYHQNFWDKAVQYDFDFERRIIHYIPKCDLSKRAEKKGKWIDTYQDGEHSFQHEYNTRIYEEGDVEKFLSHTHLKVVSIFYDYGKPKKEVMEPGWVEYVLEKS